MNNKIKYKSKIYFSLFVFGAILVLFFVFVFIPFQNDLKKNKEEYSFQKEKKALLEYKRLNIDSLNEEYKEAEIKVDELKDFFFSSENPSQALNYLEEESNNYKIGELSVSEISSFEDGEPWPYFSFQISFNSSFENFSKFLDKIENAPLMLEIERLSLTRSGENIGASIHIKFFTD
jgi:Tfp pilus assembly protein PilO